MSIDQYNNSATLAYSIGREEDLFVDAEGSFDPDYPELGIDGLSFNYKCSPAINTTWCNSI